MNGNIPYFYDYINAGTATTSPNTIHAANTGLSNFFSRYLIQKAFNVFKWKVPRTVDKNYFLYTLYCFGFNAAVYTNKYGVITQACSLKGYNVNYQPTNAVISNPLLTGILEPEIGTQCILFRLQPNYSGIMDLVGYYADMMGICVETASINLYNSKLSYVFAANKQSVAESYKQMYDQISSGNPAVVVDRSLFAEDGSPNWQPFLQNVGQNYIADRVLSDLQKWERKFLTEIGIPNANTEKKERQIQDEVNSNNTETKEMADARLEDLKEQCDAANRLFGLRGKDKFAVEWRFRENEAVANGAVQLRRDNSGQSGNPETD